MATEKLNVVALISGGKDSFFSILHCIAQGHNVIAVANLGPREKAVVLEPHRAIDSEHNEAIGVASPDDAVDDIESHMYQTVGHAVIPLYAQALSIPLYRGEITGSALDRRLEYHGSAASTLPGACSHPDGDETESLAVLLRRVMHEHPKVNAVSAGAILSTYQRTRVEAVATRLGLVPLAPLWQYPSLPCPVPAPGSLLEELAAAGLDARIIKVASGGLDDDFLWASLAEPKVRRRLAAAVNRFGGSVLGEGGEFETLVVSGPAGLFRGRIEVPDEGRQKLNLGGGEALLRIRGATVVLADRGDQSDSIQAHVRMPQLLDARFEDALRLLSENTLARSGDPEQGQLPDMAETWSLRQTILRSALTLRVSNVTSAGANAMEQIEGVCASLQETLNANRLGPDDIVFATILLRSMADFAAVNAVYVKLFTKPLPPARVTVAIGSSLSEGTHVCLSIVASVVLKSDRSGLHVQSRSYWAPANIGPYSQAISVPMHPEATSAALYVAGQIPLEPSTMRPLYSGRPFIDSAVLSAQHLWRIGAVMNAGWWTGAIAYLAIDNENSLRARQASELWRLLHTPKADSQTDEVDEGFDVWHQQRGGQKDFVPREEENKLPDFDKVAADIDSITCPGFFAIEVSELPRGCSIEWQSLGLVGKEFRVSRTKSAITSESMPENEKGLRVTFHEFAFTDTDRLSEFLEAKGLPRTLDGANLTGDPDQVLHATLYSSKPAKYVGTTAQLIPCSRIWGQDGSELLAGLILYEEKGY